MLPSSLPKQLIDSSDLDKLDLLINDAKEKALVEECNQIIKHLCITIEVLTKKKIDDPKDGLECLIGLEDHIKKDCYNIIYSFKYPQLFTNRRPDDILLFGSGDINKNLIAQKIAYQSEVILFSVSITDLLSDYMQEGDKILNMIFKAAKSHEPSIILLSELDTFQTMEDDCNQDLIRKSSSTLNIEMQYAHRGQDQSGKMVVVIGTCNKPWKMDLSLRRRFSPRYIRLPDAEARRKILELQLKDFLLAQDVDFEYLIRHTEGYSPIDITSICKETFLASQRRKISEMIQYNNHINLEEGKKGPISQKDFIKAIKSIRRSISDDDLRDYEIWKAQYFELSSYW